MEMSGRSAVALLGGMLAVWPSQAAAQLAAVSAPYQVASGGSSYARTAEVAHDSVHNVYLFATSEHQAGTVYGSFGNSSGSLVSSGFRIDTTGTYPFGPAAAYAPEDDLFLVVWINDQAQVRGRVLRYNAGGGATKVSFLSNDVLIGSGARKTWAPAVAYSATSQEFLVAWSTSAGPSWVVRVSTAGATLGSAVQVTGAVWTQEPALAWNPNNNEFMLAYAQEINPGWQVRVQRISQGQLVGSPVTVHGAGSTKMPDIGFATSSDKFLVTWFQGSPYGIYGRLINQDGSGAASAQPMLPSSYGSYDANSLSYNPASDSFATVSITSQNGLDTIGGARVSDMGVPSAANRWVEAPSGTGNRRYPEIAASSSEDRFVAVFNRAQSSFHGQPVGAGSGGGGGGSESPPSDTLSLTGLTPSPAPPVAAGTTVTWTGVATGTGTIEYQFWLYSAASNQWSVGRSWATASTWAWTPAAGGQYAVQVWARLQGSSAYQTRSSGFFSINGASSGPASLTLTGLTSNPTLPSPANTAVTWNANATVSGGTAEYQFWVYSAAAGAWSVGRAWSADSSWTWTPTTAGQYAVQVWARLAGQSAYQTRASGFFNITAAASQPGSLTLIGISADPLPPFAINTQVTWSGIASVSSGATAEYQFWLYSAASATWTVARAWSTSNSFAWTPTAPGTYAVQVWARLVGTTTHQYAASGFFTVSTTAGEAAPVTITSLTSTPSSSYTAGNAVTWNAVATGSGALHYSYWVYRASTNTWTNVRAYSSTSSHVWTPPAAGTYAVQVWVRRSGQTLAYEAMSSTGFFTVN